MSMYKGLEHVQFGHIAAEEEERALRSYFLETPEYVDILQTPERILVIGRKGSGKSAVYLSLKDAGEGKIIGLTLQDYPWEIHKRIKDSGAPQEHIYVNSWKYTLWVLLAKEVIGYSRPSKFRLWDPVWWRNLLNGNRRYLKNFLKRAYGSIAPSFTEVLVDRARNIRLFQIQGVKVESDVGPPEIRLSQLINFANRELESRILSLLPSKDAEPIYLLFDQLDLGWDGSEESKLLLIGLILAARDVMRAAIERNKNLRVILFLRSDIYEQLRFEDKNKLSDSIVRLVWDENRLRDLISRRIQASARGDWNDVFTDERLRSSQSPLRYIVKRTMLRPRDMIRFCSFALECAKSHGIERIDNACIYEAERPYSDYMRNEIIDESKSLQSARIDVLFETLKELGKEIVKKEEFLVVCRQRGIDGALALQELIALSVLGVYRRGGSRGGSRVMYRYETPSWENLRPSDELRVHPSLKYALELTEPRKHQGG